MSRIKSPLHHLIATLFFIVGLSLSHGATAQEKPPLPYYDWGACPFECCTYQTWHTIKPVIIYKTHSKASPEAFHLSVSESVKGLTGVVITNKAGITKVVAPMTIDAEKKSSPVALRSGELLYTLHYLGEGYDLFWYQGKIYKDQISTSEGPVYIVSRPDFDWWVKVKNRNGQIGWTDQTDAFNNIDACGE